MDTLTVDDWLKRDVGELIIELDKGLRMRACLPDDEVDSLRTIYLTPLIELVIEIRRQAQGWVPATTLYDRYFLFRSEHGGAGRDYVLLPYNEELGTRPAIRRWEEMPRFTEIAEVLRRHILTRDRAVIANDSVVKPQPKGAVCPVAREED